MMAAAAPSGVDTPVSYGPAELGTAARDDLHFPVVVKPLATPRFFARFGAKLGVANDREELRRVDRTRWPGADPRESYSIWFRARTATSTRTAPTWIVTVS